MPATPRPALAFLSIAAFAVALLGVSTGCPSQTDIKPPPSPKRPKEKNADNEVVEVPADCEAIDPRALPPSVAYEERSIDESQNLANQGFTKLNRADEADVGKIERENLIDDAVDLFITALRADPYNVHATYNLAAAYARINRVQCSINMLERLVDLRKLRSQKDKVEAKLDRLFGRGRFKRKLDPDFSEMRRMEIFRDLVKKFCPSLPRNGPLEQCR